MMTQPISVLGAIILTHAPTPLVLFMIIYDGGGPNAPNKSLLSRVWEHRPAFRG